MSLAYGTYCLDCKKQGPEMGDFGMAGLPVWSKREPSNKPHMENDDATFLTFGKLYKGLEAMSMLTREVEAYRAFLEKHDGHWTYLSSDHDEETPPELDELLEQESLEEFVLEDNDFTLGHYTLSCKACSDVLCFENRYKQGIRAFKPFVPDAAQRETFASCYLEHRFDLYHAGYLMDYEDAEAMGWFWERHDGHEIKVNLEPEVPENALTPEVYVKDQEERREKEVQAEIKARAARAGETPPQPARQKKAPAGVKEKFKARRKRHLIATIATVSYLALMMFVVRRFVPPTSPVTDYLFAGLLAAVLVWFVLYVLSLRCPGCGKFLGKGFNQPRCPRCDAELLGP